MGFAQSNLAFACGQSTDEDVPHIPALAEAFPCPIPGPNDQRDKIWIVDRLLEPQTFPHFLGFCMSGKLPNGKTSSLPILTYEEIKLSNTPYKDWATSRYRRLGDCAAGKIAEAVGSFEDSSCLVVVQQPIHHMKSRIWEGILSMSDKRWRALDLDSKERHHEACEHLGSVIRVFDYLNQPQNQKLLRHVYDKISSHLVTFGDALNEVRSAEGQATVSMKDLWTEYMCAQCDMMTTRAHTWLLSHASALRQRLLDDLDSSSSDVDARLPKQPIELDGRFMDLTELIARADYTILFSFLASPQADGLHSEQLQSRREAYTATRVTDLADQLFLNATADTTHHVLHPTSWLHFCNRIVEGQDELRIELRGDPKPMPIEPWIAHLLWQRQFTLDQGTVPESNGFVIYRLASYQSEEQWASFVQMFEADLAESGEDILASAKVENWLQVRWLNGKDLGIAEGDVDAAKRHFIESHDSDPLSSDMMDDCFLVVDSHCVDSYLSTENISHSSSEDGGFVLAVDALFNPAEPDDHEDESPGYSGVLRVMGSLVWSDLFAMLSAQTLGPREMWPLAIPHPHQVYIGPKTQRVDRLL